jgi:putative transposase
VTTPTSRRRHRVSALQAHLVFMTKYRQKVFNDATLTFCEHAMRAGCAELDSELAEFNGEADHVHQPLAYPLTLSISALVQPLIGRTAHAVRREYTGGCLCARLREQLWSPSCFAISRACAPMSITKQYIDSQARPL